MAQTPARAASAVRLFDAHCHLQDPRVAAVAPALIRAAAASGVARFAVNGTSEKDWHLVKRMAEDHPAAVPCFGLHPWWVPERSPDWMDSLRRFFAETPEAAVGEIGLDKGSHGRTIDFGEQVEVFRRQLELAKELERPVSVHCVRAFGDLLEILKQTGPFPAGVLLHSYLGSAEMVFGLANLGCYLSLSGFLTGMKSSKAKQMLKSIPLDRILLETDGPDALPKLDNVSVSPVPVHSSDAHTEKHHKDSESQAATASNGSLNHPEISISAYPLQRAPALCGVWGRGVSGKPYPRLCNARKLRLEPGTFRSQAVLKYVASLLEMPEAELAELSYKNATKLFCYPGSKVHLETGDI
ncbi:tat-linked quality control protein TatD [Panicum miliaceum]|uniref:Tat-linked quality control protein TatD n=1 Tax=Panicum miliaceum TaxID=4540 RepID=A0A3L6QDF2_PANMI|nr:tat-linked quality control protein TatD [Panicum miliaceum]